MSKKIIAMVFILLMVMLSGCGAISKATTSTIYINTKGKVSSVTVEALPAQQYSEEDLKNLIDLSIAEYNSGQDEEKIKLDGFKVKGDQARLTMSYATSLDYEGFNGRVLFWGTVSEAIAAGYKFDMDFIDEAKAVTKGSVITAPKAEDNQKEEQVIITNEPVQIQTTKDILYTSKNATIIDERLVQVEAEAGATDNGITFGNSENAYIIFGDKPKENKEASESGS